ncbi:MAG: hypothetical protein H0T17_01245 [Propionibacteriales bacterium]|nr:hypothetical protein [Propionibacteriales bacterium]
MTTHRTPQPVRAAMSSLAAAALAVSILALAPAPSSHATTSLAASVRAIINAARHDRPEPPDRCSYDAGVNQWPPATKTRACLRHRGSGKTVLLVGDSHAEHWSPAFSRIARQRHWTFYTLTRARCSPMNYVAVRKIDRRRPTIGEICANWRKVAYPTVIKRYDPDLVFFGGRSQVYNIRVDDHVVRMGSGDWLHQWRKSWRWTVRTLGAKGARLGALTLQPTMHANIPDCLDRYGLRTDMCNTRIVDDRQTIITNRFIHKVNSTYPRVRPIPVNNLVCPKGLCRARIDGLITHADMSHLTARWSRSQGDEIIKILRSRKRL